MFGPSPRHKNKTKSKRLQNQPEWRLLPEDSILFLVFSKLGFITTQIC